MKIAIMSDSHDNLDHVRSAVKIICDKKVEVILHAGDINSPFVVNELEKTSAKVFAVYGNNDGERVGLQARMEKIGRIKIEPLFFELQGKQISIMHDPGNVDKLAASGVYDLLVYGHTHKLDIRKTGKTLIINPGELGGWVTGISTFVILDFDTMEPETIKLT